MKLKHLLVSSLVAASSVSLFAAPDDRKIEDAARASYSYRTVLEDKVAAKSSAGAVTLTGMVADKELKSFAEDTVTSERVVVVSGVAANAAEKSFVGKLAQSIRGVKFVTNPMAVKI